MDLRIKNNNATKSYVITNNCTTRPRVCMKSDTGVPATPISYLPLTTSTTQGLALRAKVNDQSYRALEFRSMSGSATFYSSNANGQGLSSTTALTRASTSRTEYLTQSSTSRTEYLTRSSTSATSYLTRSSTSGESYLTKYGTQTLITMNYTSVRETSYYLNNSTQVLYALATITRIVTQSDRSLTVMNPNTTYATNMDPTPWYDGYYRVFGYLSLPQCTGTINQTVTYRYRTGDTVNTVSTNRLPTPGFLSRFWSDHYSGRNFTGVNQYIEALSQSLGSMTNLLFTLSNSWADYFSDNTSGQTYNLTATRNTVTTGTSYLTRSSTYSTVYYTRSSTYDTVYYTRSSTYSTVYHTRSSTSGYSGVSSSSSETSGWQ